MGNGMSVLFWINRARISKITQMAPIYARITICGKRAEISTGKSALVEKWIANVGRVKGHNEESRTSEIGNLYQQVMSKTDFWEKIRSSIL